MNDSFGVDLATIGTELAICDHFHQRYKYSHTRQISAAWIGYSTANSFLGQDHFLGVWGVDR